MEDLLHLAYRHVQRGDYGGAEPLLERVVAANPADARAWCALGALRNSLGRDNAAAAFRAALAADAHNRDAYQSLAELALGSGDAAAAIEWLTAGLARLPGDPTFLHLLAAACGETTARPPEGHVQSMFDSMANDFDRHLRDLAYRVPEALAGIVMPWLRANRPARVIDLGCGTGLVGAALAGSGAEVTGIDASGEMLRRASERGAYARLVQGDLVSELERTVPSQAHAILAADVFIYLGDLQPVFAAASRALVPGGRFAFSIEDLLHGKYQLQRSGRYAQSISYVRELAAGFREEKAVQADLRKEGAGYAKGWIACLVKV